MNDYKQYVECLKILSKYSELENKIYCNSIYGEGLIDVDEIPSLVYNYSINKFKFKFDLYVPYDEPTVHYKSLKEVQEIIKKIEGET